MRHASTVVAAALMGLVLVSSLYAAKAIKVEEAGWVKLGSRDVGFKEDHDVIEVGKAEGKFTQIRLNVEDGDMILEKIKVTFGNGDTFEPTARLEFKKGTRSNIIELPPKVHGRAITRVDFVYHSEHKHEKATVVLYAKEK